ncbi:hypothetical protein AKJ48_01325, partial [candidate division MSBL1 archaeon SCGC-AAA261O19]
TPKHTLKTLIRAYNSRDVDAYENCFSAWVRSETPVNTFKHFLDVAENWNWKLRGIEEWGVIVNTANTRAWGNVGVRVSGVNQLENNHIIHENGKEEWIGKGENFTQLKACYIRFVNEGNAGENEWKIADRPGLFQPVLHATLDLVSAIENHIKTFYPPDDVGYEITYRSGDRVKGFIYLKGENDRVPFEDIELKLKNGHWNLYPSSWDTTVRSPSENLEITGYSVDKATVGSSEWSEMQEVLVRIAPTVRNWSDYPAFVSSVHIRIENSTHTFTRSYPAGVVSIGLISIGIVPSGRTVRIGYRGGLALIPKWSSGGSKSILRMDELAGKNFRVTLTLKDGEGTTLAKRTFHITFEDLSEKQRNVKLEPSLADLDLSGSTQVNFSREQFFHEKQQ